MPGRKQDDKQFQQFLLWCIEQEERITEELEKRTMDREARYLIQD
jgi:hypothetical protein